ncbi:MAG: HNH endonuclease signature motif containing protein [Janthinobacterium lividum]
MKQEVRTQWFKEQPITPGWYEIKVSAVPPRAWWDGQAWFDVRSKKRKQLTNQLPEWRGLVDKPDNPLEGKSRKLFKWWTEDEVEMLRRRYPHEKTSDIAADFGRPEKEVCSKASTMGLKKINSSSGQIPNRNYKAAIGTIVLVKGGYFLVKVAHPKLWKPLHRILWEENFGSIPLRHCIVFKDNNPLNCVVENLECTPYKELKNRLNQWPPELQEVILLDRAIEKHINERASNEQ